MLQRLGDTLVRRRWWVLGATLIFVGVAGWLGGGVAQELTGGGFEDPNAESARAAAALEEVFETGDPNVVLLVTAADGDVNDPAVAEAGMALTSALSQIDGVTDVASYWALGSAPPLRSSDGSQALVLARMDEEDEAVADSVRQLVATSSQDPITVEMGGASEVFREIQETVETDLVRAESIAFPITLGLLVVVFGSLVAASLPLVVGGIAIIGTFLALSLINQVTDVSIFALNLTTALGLGLGIDYSLFVVSRFREELAKGLSTHDAVVATVGTAGRTVAFSAVTVAISLGALVVFPLGFLRSFAYAGVAVVLIAGITAVVVLPALLAVLGPKVNSLRIFRRQRQVDDEHGFWARLANLVMRRPIPFVATVLVVLVVLGTPFLRVEFGLSDDRVLAPDNEVRMVQDDLREGFASDEAATVTVVARDASPATPEQLTEYATELSAVPGVARVDAADGTYVGGIQVAPANPLSARYASGDATWFGVIPSVEPVSPEGQQLVEDVRAIEAPVDVLVGGPSAGLADATDSLFSRLPWALAIIGVVTFALLFLMFGSVLVPVKALVLNVLSLSATFGALVWIFQEGNLSGPLNFTATGTLDSTLPILLFCVAFGLSMDYEVFLLSRIKEEYDLTGDNTRSVSMGLQRTGRIVTAAAAVLSVVLIAFATSSVTILKVFGIGMTLAVLLDATLVRGILVPAFMRLAGNANWWAPRWMRRIYERFGISESEAASSDREPVRT